jgi:hypothetical protein
MDSQTSPVDTGETLQAYLASLQDDFRRALVESLRRSVELNRVEHVNPASISAPFEFVVDGSRQRRQSMTLAQR